MSEDAGYAVRKAKNYFKPVSKSNGNCSVSGCRSVRKKNSNLMYHGFPKQGVKICTRGEWVEARALWIHILKIDRDVSKHMKVCSKHFKEEDYACSGWSSHKRLLPNAVPSLNIPPGKTQGSNFSCMTKALEMYMCERCNYSANLMVDLIEHVRTLCRPIKTELEEPPIKIDQSQRYSCGECNFGTFSQLVLMEHVYSGECAALKRSELRDL